MKKPTEIQYTYIICLLLLLLTAGYLLLNQGFTKSILELANQVIPDLIAAAIITLSIIVFLKRKGLDSETQLREEIVSNFIERTKKNLTPKTIESFAYKIIQYKNSKLLRLSDSEKIFLLADKFKKAEEVWVNGYSCLLLVKNFKKEIEDAVARGVKFRFILIDPQSQARKMMETRDKNRELKRVQVDINTTRKELEGIIEKLSIEGRYLEGSIRVRYTEWIPSCSMILIDPEEDYGELKIKVYPLFYSTGHYNPLEIILGATNHKDQYDYFKEQFNRLWTRDSKEIIP